MKCGKPFKYAIGGVNVVQFQPGDKIEDAGAQRFAQEHGYAEAETRTTEKPAKASGRNKAASAGSSNKDEDAS